MAIARCSTTARLVEEFDDAVKIRMRSDVPVAYFPERRFGLEPYYDYGPAAVRHHAHVRDGVRA